MAKHHSPRFLSLVDSVRPLIQECTIHDLKTLLDSQPMPTIVDVREESEFASGHLPGAKHLSKGVIERDVEAAIPDTSTTIYLYCGGGFRSALTADSLQKMGYTNVVSVDGGWRAWTEAGYPVSHE